MTNINYESTMLKYGVSDLFMSELATLMLQNKGLSESMKTLKNNHDCEDIDLKKLYVLSSSIANSIMGEELSLICPKMQAERDQMKSSATVKFKSNSKNTSSKNEGLDELEMLLEEIEEAMFEVGDIAL